MEVVFWVSKIWNNQLKTLSLDPIDPTGSLKIAFDVVNAFNFEIRSFTFVCSCLNHSSVLLKQRFLSLGYLFLSACLILQPICFSLSCSMLTSWLTWSVRIFTVNRQPIFQIACSSCKSLICNLEVAALASHSRHPFERDFVILSKLFESHKKSLRNFSPPRGRVRPVD